MESINEKKSIFYYIANDNISRTILSIFLGFIVGAIFLEILGYDSIFIYKTLFKLIFSNRKAITNTIVFSSPYILTGLSVAIGLKAGIFNIGAEGQFVMGSLIACVIGIVFNDLSPIILVPFCMLGGMVGGMLWGSLAAFLKIKFKINEVLSMIMLNWVAFYFSNFIVTLPMFKNESGYNASKVISKNAMIIFSKDFISKYDIAKNSNYGIFLVILLAIITYIIIEKTTLGYEIKAVGKNINASLFNGINVNKITIITFLLSGVMSGFAGAIQLMGMSKRVSEYVVQEGFGFGGIVVALIGMVNPIACILSGFFYGALKFSGRSLNLINAPTQVIDIVVGTIIFFISISSIFKYLENIKTGGKK